MIRNLIRQYMDYLILKRPNYLGDTSYPQYTQRPGTVSFFLSGINQTSGVSQNNPAAYYTDNTLSTTPVTTENSI